MEPITSTFNIVINAIARDRHYNAGVRAEQLLYKMEELSANGGLCAPDEISFNAVMNCWAESNNREAALRATAILDHMEKRYDAGLTEIHPDHVTFNTVLKSWSRSKDWEALAHAEKVFDKYKQAIAEKKWDIYPSALTYNTMIRCYVQNKSPRATDQALKLFQEMRTNSGKPGWELCFVDIYTYCFLIEAFANQGTFEASRQAISLMEEVEKKYEETEDPKFQPNIQLYTNVLKAIARSRKEPERSQKIVDRLEASHLEGKTQWQSRPDVWLYNSLINAYGWSDVKGKSKKCFTILQHMIDLYESKTILDAKPDLVTFNSVLNACVFEVPSTDCSHEDVMKIAVETFELLTAKDDSSKERGRFGKPDHHTYAQMLMVITNHLPEEDEKRISLAEALFFQCAEDGLVTERSIVKLEAALPKPNFEKILGSALIADKDRVDGQEQRFDMNLLPQKWTANVEENPRRRAKTSRSRRRDNSFQVTKRSILNRSS
jgi:pentatricopeptide repeat protein